MTYLLIIIAINLILYFPTLRYGYSTDDEEMICRIKDGFFKNRRGLEFIRLRLYGAGTFGLNQEVDHAVTITLHTLICCLIYIAFGNNIMSFFASVLYSFNPINHSTSIWLNGRRYAINIILSLSALIFFKYGLWGKGITFILYLSTGIFHMTAVFLPVLFGIDYILALIVMYILFEKPVNTMINNRMSLIADCDMKKFTPKRLIVAVKSYGFYFWRILIPGVCALIYPDLFYWEKTKEGNKNAYGLDRSFIQGIGALSLSFMAIFFLPANYRYWGIFTFLSILQWCNFLPVLQTLADRYVSVAVPFIMFFLSYLLSLTGTFYIPIVILICTYYYLGLSVVLPMYKDIVIFYEYHIARFPQIPVPRLAYIECLMLQGKLEYAQKVVQDGLKANPRDFEMLRFGALFLLFKQVKWAGLALCAEAEKNFYIGQEEEQHKVINNLRNLLNAIKTG